MNKNMKENFFICILYTKGLMKVNLNLSLGFIFSPATIYGKMDWYFGMKVILCIIIRHERKVFYAGQKTKHPYGSAGHTASSGGGYARIPGGYQC